MCSDKKRSSLQTAHLQGPCLLGVTLVRVTTSLPCMHMGSLPGEVWKLVPLGSQSCLSGGVMIFEWQEFFFSFAVLGCPLHALTWVFVE